MKSNRCLFPCVLLVICLLWAPSAAWAASRAWVGVDLPRLGLWGLASFFEWGSDRSDGAVVPMPKHGCEIDPNGAKCPSVATLPKHGCDIDPNGVSRCTP